MSLNHPEGSKAELLAKYKSLKEASPTWSRCPVCCCMDTKNLMEPHHPCGRSGTNILLFVWLHPACHRAVHDDPAQASRSGMLWPGRNRKMCSPEEWEALQKLWPINNQ